MRLGGPGGLFTPVSKMTLIGAGVRTTISLNLIDYGKDAPYEIQEGLGVCAEAVVFASIFLCGATKQTQTVQKADEQSTPLIRSVEGPDLFRAYCASCHGVTATGKGPAASELKAKVPDLTLLV